MTCNKLAQWFIVGEMSKMHIYDIPGEDAKVLTSTLFEYCRWMKDPDDAF